jgi:ornithine decarboxylase
VNTLDTLARTGVDDGLALETPYLVLDLDEVVARYRAMLASLPVERLHYAVKANPHPAIIEALSREGCGFEISSPGELRLLVEAGVAPSRIVSSNPVKTPAFIALAHDRGVERFAVDSTTELDKLAAGAPGARVYCRVEVDNSGSMWPLARKFGCKPGEAVRLLEAARARGLRPDGLTFHVGSQCLSAASWRLALERCAEVWRAAAQRGIRLEQIDIGGGFPVDHLQPVPGLESIGAVVVCAIEELFPPDVVVSAEPGRGLVGPAGRLVASVIGKAERGGEKWLYLDVGVFNGLMETIEQFRYELRVEREGPPRRWTIAGPSCDSVDVLWADALLPELEVGDRVEILNAGAYTLSYASSFNGFPPPQVHVRGG